MSVERADGQKVRNEHLNSVPLWYVQEVAVEKLLGYEVMNEMINNRLQAEWEKQQAKRSA